jgi:hypothetical protein
MVLSTAPLLEEVLRQFEDRLRRRRSGANCPQPTPMDGPQPSLPDTLRPLARGVATPPMASVALALFTLLLVIGTSMAATAAPKQQGALGYLPWRRPEKTSWFKGWSGLRMPNDIDGDQTELTIAYVHEETLALIELGKGRSLRNCELIELL